MIRDKAICFPTYRVQNFRMLLPSSSEGYYNPSAHHPSFQQQLIYYSGAYIVWEEGAFTYGGRFGVSPYSSSRILACWDESLHHHLIYILENISLGYYTLFGRHSPPSNVEGENTHHKACSKGNASLRNLVGVEEPSVLLSLDGERNQIANVT